MSRYGIIIALGFACTLLHAADQVPAGAAVASLPVVDSSDFEAKVLQSAQPVIVDFYADWCITCKQQEPDLVMVSAEFAPAVRTYKVDFDTAQELADRYGIQEIPALLVFSGGKAGSLNVGVHDVEQLRKIYASALEQEMRR